MFSNEWNEILNEVLKFQRSCNVTWYRGHSKSWYKLESGLYRKKLSKPSNYIIDEKNAYQFFSRMGHSLHKESNWNLLFLMQHYGVRTRLLDWSESFAVALYFAISKWDMEENCTVWLLNPLELNYMNSNKGKRTYLTLEGSYWEKINDINNPKISDNTFALYPLRNSPRIVSQQGMFTLQGKLGIPLEEEQNGELIEAGILKRIDISPTLYGDIRNYLKLCGINAFTLFPDLDGLSKYINNKEYINVKENQLAISN